MAMPLAVILHPEGNINNNPGLTGIVELLVRDGWRVDIHSPRDGAISQRAPCAGARMVLAEPATASQGCILSHPGGKLTPESRYRFGAASMIIGVDRGIIEASAIAKALGKPFGLISYEIFFSSEAGADFKAPEIEACRGLSFAIVQDEARARELGRENRIDRERMFLVPVAGCGSFPPPDPRPRLFHEMFGLPADARVALFMGSVAKWSLCDELVESVRNWPANWHLVIHNRYALDHATRGVDSRTRDMLLGMRGENRIHFSSRPFDLPSQMRDFIFSADLGVAFYRPTYNNIWEGKNLLHIGMASGKIASYLQHGVPVAVNRIGEMSDRVADRGIGQVVEDPRAFVPDDAVLAAAPRCIEYFEERLDPTRTLQPWLRRVARFKAAEAISVDDFREFHYSKRRHFDLFRELDIELFHEKVDPDYCDLKAYQDLLIFAFIKKYVPAGSRILDIGGGDSRILRHFKDEYECWNLDKLEGVGNGPRSVEASGYRMVSDYIGNFNAELPEEYFDFVFSISTLEHVPSGLETNRELYRNICIDLDRVLKPGGFSLHCFDILLSSGTCWANEFMDFMAVNCMADAPGITLEEMERDPERYVISRKFFDDYWKLPAVDWGYDAGMPSSCNVFWKKGAAGASRRDPALTWDHYKRFEVERDERYPRISVVTPSFNQAPFLAEAIESVLGQRYPNLEYIVMDGGSADGSVDIIRRYGKFLTHWQSMRDGGQYRAINEGFQRATGEIMTWINSDDRLQPGAFAHVALAFMEQPQIRWIMSRPNGIDAEGRQSWVFDHLPAWSRAKYLDKQYRDPYIQQEGTFWRKSLWDQAGGYLRGDMQFAGDLELWTRFFRHAQLHSADALLGSYRQHPGQKTGEFLEKYHQEADVVLDFEREFFRRAKDKTLVPAPPPLLFSPDASPETPPGPVRSNLGYWKAIQDEGYFESHSCYGGLVDTGGADLMIDPFVDLDREMTAVVIGCGYGRDTLHIAPRVKVVYGIDVTPGILRKATRFLSEHDVRNFVPVLADEWKDAIPAGIDFVFSIIVFQHLTRDLVKDYVAGLGRKLSGRGLFVCQFADLDYGTSDADLRQYEPSVRWSVAEIEELVRETGLFLHAIESVTIPEHGRWHWACFGKTERN